MAKVVVWFGPCHFTLWCRGRCAQEGAGAEGEARSDGGERLVLGVVGYTYVAIDTKRGRFTIRQEHTPSSPEEPMTAADRVEKFMDCAGRVLGEKGAKSLLEQLEDLENAKNVATVMAAMAPREGSKEKVTV